MRRINYDLAKVTISVFIEQRDISFQNDFSLKTMRLGALSLSWEKFEKNHETHCRIVSLDQFGSQRAIILLIFSSLLSGRVKTLLKFINFCLKVDHSANLKHSKSTWRQLVVLWKVQHHNIKSYIWAQCMLRRSWSWNRNDRSMTVVVWCWVLSCRAD